MEDSKGKRVWLGEYTLPYFAFVADLQNLKDLNTILGQSIEQAADRQKQEVQKEIMKLDGKTKEQIETALTSLKDLKSADLTVENKKAAHLIVRKLTTDDFPYRAGDFVRDMSLVYLVTKFENTLAQVFKLTFTDCPQLLKTSGKNMTYEEILDFDDVTDLKRSLINRETQSIIDTTDIAKIDSVLSRTFHVKFQTSVNLNEFGERFYRRNIIVHSEGMPDRIYRLKTGYTGPNHPLHVSSEYLNAAIDQFAGMAYDICRSFQCKFSRLPK